MNKTLLCLKTAFAAMLFLASGLAVQAQLTTYLTATLRSQQTNALIPNKVLIARSYTNSPGTQFSQSSTTNQSGVAQFQLPWMPNSANNTAWLILAVHQGDTIPLDSVVFPSAGFQAAKIFYLNNTTNPDCTPVVTASQIPGTTLWKIKADTANFRQCFGYGWLAYSLEVDNVWVDSNGVSPFGINGANEFMVNLAQGTHSLCITVMGPGIPAVPAGCVSVTIGGFPQNSIQGFVYSNGQATEEDVIVELFGANNTYRLDTLNWPMDSSFYYFGNLGQGYYYVRATPLGGNNVSTYFTSSLTWQGATPILMPGLTMPPLQYSNIELVPFFNGPTGPGIVQGYLSGANNGTNVTTSLPGGMGTANTTFTGNRVRVLVTNGQGQPVGYTTLNPDGTFFLDGLPEGTYTLIIDHPMVNTLQRPLVFTQTNNVASVQATVNSSGMSVVTGTKDALNHAGISVFPNPAQNQIFIRNFEQVKNLTLVNVLGVATEIAPSASLKLDDQKAGIYFLSGETKTGETFKIRIIKQ